MKQYITIKVDEDVIDEVYCNQCEKCITDFDYVEIVHIWGFFSKKDGLSYNFDLCEGCVDTLIKSFKFPPKIESYQ